MRTRVIPVLLVRNRRLVKTISFSRETYLGDPINAIRLYNEMEVDELVVLDIGARKKGASPDFEFIERLTSECFMPITYGGGIRNLEEISALYRLGIEKVSLNLASIWANPNGEELVRSAVRRHGSQSLVLSIDIKKSIFGKFLVYDHARRSKIGVPMVQALERAQGLGVGEVLLNSVNRDGHMDGYDLSLISHASDVLRIPWVICGGAGNLDHLREAAVAGAHATGAGSLFVFQGTKRGVLINYPSQERLERLFSDA